MRSSGISSPSSQLEYLIAPDDVLDVYIVDVQQLSRDYRVGPDGTIVLPLLSHSIKAAGLTPWQLSAVIADRLRSDGLISTPHVLVTVKSSTAHAVAIMGAVKNPQIYSVFGPTTLLDVLAQAGGLGPDAGDTAIITRGEMAMRNSGLASNATDSELLALADPTVKVDLLKLLKRGDPGLNLAIYPGDKVTVERAGIVYVEGAVGRPGGYVLTGSWRDMTVLKAIALAGDVNSEGAEKKAVILRPDPSAPEGRREIAINLKKILAGRAPDDRLEANDILYVPTSTLRRALHIGTGAGVAIGTGIAVYHPY